MTSKSRRLFYGKGIDGSSSLAHASSHLQSASLHLDFWRQEAIRGTMTTKRDQEMEPAPSRRTWAG
jgi:hypothetical protein